jgi:hypothetical protein
MSRRRIVRLQRFEHLSPLLQVHPRSGVPAPLAESLSPYEEIMTMKSFIC